MSTHSLIAKKYVDGSYRSIHCHFDGYLSHTGRILLDHYSDPQKIERLMDEGDLRVIGSELGEEHSLEEYNKRWCTFFGRDCKEYESIAYYHSSFEKLMDHFTENSYPYLYVYDGQWKFLYKYLDKKLQLLTNEKIKS